MCSFGKEGGVKEEGIRESTGGKMRSQSLLDSGSKAKKSYTFFPRRYRRLTMCQATYSVFDIY